MERKFTVDGREHTIETSSAKLESSFRGGEGFLSLTIDGVEHAVEVLELGAHHLDLLVDGKRIVAYTGRAEGAGKELWVSRGGRARLVAEAERRARGGAGADGGSRLVTPQFPATVVKLLVEVGETVSLKQPLVTVSAMKMEMTLSAPYDGVVTSINAAEGENVSPGDSLIDIKEQPADEDPKGGTDE